VTLRIPRSLHRALAAAAEEEGVSLNAHLVGVLTYYSGFAAASRSTTPTTWTTVPKPNKAPQLPSPLRLVQKTKLA
jgi:hypothetical protein